jgi:hypothetical protein
VEEAREASRGRRGPHIPHQATLFLEGSLGEEGFSSPRLPRGCRVEVAGYALTQPEEHRGEGVFGLWPRTDGEGRLLAERAFPLGKWALARKGERPLPEPIEGDRNPHLEGRRKGPAPKEAQGRPEEARRPAPPEPESPPEPPGRKAPPPRKGPRRDPVRVWRAPEEEAPKDLGLPPPLPKGQVMGLVGEGPYFLVLRPEALGAWWPKVERLLPEFPRRHEVRLFPDGSRAVVAWDLEALKVWYKRVLRG